MSKLRDKKLQDSFKGKPCIIHGTTETTVPAHIIKVSRRPDLADNPVNLWPLCYFCHDFQEGNTEEFVERYHLKEFLLNRGFYLRINSKGNEVWDYPYKMQYEDFIERKRNRWKRNRKK